MMILVNVVLWVFFIILKSLVLASDLSKKSQDLIKSSLFKDNLAFFYFFSRKNIEAISIVSAIYLFSHGLCFDTL